jgi:hypothetical protein
MLFPIPTWGAFWNLRKVYFYNFPIFFRATVNRGYWISGSGTRLYFSSFGQTLSTLADFPLHIRSPAAVISILHILLSDPLLLYLADWLTPVLTLLTYSLAVLKSKYSYVFLEMCFTIWQIPKRLASRNECCGTPIQSSLKFITMELSMGKREGGDELDSEIWKLNWPSFVSYLFSNATLILFCPQKISCFNLKIHSLKWSSDVRLNNVQKFNFHSLENTPSPLQ